MSSTSTATIERPAATDEGPATPVAIARKKGHVGRIVAGSLIGGLVTAVFLVAVPFAGRTEAVITGSVLLTFAAAWFALATLSQRWTDQPQRWAFVPASFMTLAGGVVLVLAPTGNELGWVWPPVVAALVAWMIVRARRDLRSRTRVWLLYPVCAALVLSCIGGAYETYRESTDNFPMAGRLIDVGGHKLHIDCTGTGSPTVVLEPGLGEPSTAMAWIAPDVATTTRVCVYDRAGRGWSESASGPQDGVEVATDLHTLLARAGERGTVRACRSLGRRHLRPQLRPPLPPSRSRESSCSTRCIRSSTGSCRHTPRSTTASAEPSACSRRSRASASGDCSTKQGTAIFRRKLVTKNAPSCRHPATTAACATSLRSCDSRWHKRSRSRACTGRH